MQHQHKEIFTDGLNEERGICTVHVEPNLCGGVGRGGRWGGGELNIARLASWRTSGHLSTGRGGEVGRGGIKYCQSGILENQWTPLYAGSTSYR